jgi:hypothetical protein
MPNLLELKDKTARTLKEIYESVRLTDDGEGFEIPFEHYFMSVTFGEYTEDDQVKWRDENGLPLTFININSYVMDRIKPSSKFYEYISIELPQKILSQHYVFADPAHKGRAMFALFNRIAGDSADPNEIKFAVLNSNWDSNTAGELLKENFEAKWIGESD